VHARRRPYQARPTDAPRFALRRRLKKGCRTWRFGPVISAASENHIAPGRGNPEGQLTEPDSGKTIILG
jgi:hypothetical protein